MQCIFCSMTRQLGADAICPALGLLAVSLINGVTQSPWELWNWQARESVSCFEWEKFPRDSGIWTLDSQVVTLWPCWRKECPKNEFCVENPCVGANVLSLLISCPLSSLLSTWMQSYELSASYTRRHDWVEHWSSPKQRDDCFRSYNANNSAKIAIHCTNVLYHGGLKNMHNLNIKIRSRSLCSYLFFPVFLPSSLPERWLNRVNAQFLEYIVERENKLNTVLWLHMGIQGFQTLRTCTCIHTNN